MGTASLELAEMSDFAVEDQCVVKRRRRKREGQARNGIIGNVRSALPSHHDSCAGRLTSGRTAGELTSSQCHCLPTQAHALGGRLYPNLACSMFARMSIKSQWPRPMSPRNTTLRASIRVDASIVDQHVEAFDLRAHDGALRRIRSNRWLGGLPITVDDPDVIG
jgi:hypothetical protein